MTTFDFAALAEVRPPLVSGKHVIELQAGSWAPTANKGGMGVAFAIKIAEGPQAGREVRLQLMLKAAISGTERVAERDREVLARWAKGVGAKGGETLDAAMTGLWRASRSWRVIADLVVIKDGRGLSNVEVSAINVEPMPEAQPTPTVSEIALVHVSKDHGGSKTSAREAGDEPVV
jgi:hypothetical protein